MQRYLPFALWVGITGTLLLVALADGLSGAVGWRNTGRRMLLVAVWPIALLTRRGRDFIFNVGRKL